MSPIKKDEGTLPDVINFKSNFKTIWVGGIVTIIVTGLVALIAYSTGNWNTILLRDYVAVFTGGAVTTTLFYHAKNLKNNFDANQEKLNFDLAKFEYEKEEKARSSQNTKKILSVEICSWWFKPDMAPNVERVRCFLRKHETKLKDHKPIREFISALDNNIEDRQALVSILNLFEHIAILIKKELADEEILKDAYKAVFCSYYERLQRYIKKRQKKSVLYLINYEEIARKWTLS